MRIIKFCTNNNFLINSLQKSELYFNKVENFNDPFEGIFRFKLWSDEKKIKEFYIKHFSGDIKKLNFYIQNKGELEKEINKNLAYRQSHNAVTCFSIEENLTDILMWGHYANSHGGVCLLFESSELDFTPGSELAEEALINHKLIGSPTGPYEVIYKDQYINTDPISGNLNAQSFLTTKFRVWSYEKEFRFIASQQGLYHFNPSSLKKIIFGLRTPANQKVQIRNISKKFYPNVEFQRIKLKDNDFALEIEPELFKS